MKLHLLFLLFALVCRSSVAADNEYSNSGYGISLTKLDNWKFGKTAKLGIPLKKLTDGQLKELLDGYQSGIVTIERELPGTKTKAFITIHMNAYGKKLKSPLEFAASMAKGAASRDDDTIVQAHEMKISGLDSAHVATIDSTNARVHGAFRIDYYVVGLKRSYLYLRCISPTDANEDVLAEQQKMVESLKIDPSADSPEE